MSHTRSGALVVITGSTASGKSSVARMLSKDIGWPYVEFGELARTRFREYLALQHDGGDLQTFVQDVLWHEHGQDVLALDLLRRVPDHLCLVAVGPRSPAEIETLRLAGGGRLVLVHLIVPEAVRFARDLKRTWKYEEDRSIGEYSGFGSRDAIERIWGVEQAGRMSHVLLVRNTSVSLAVRQIVWHLRSLGLPNSDDRKTTSEQHMDLGGPGFAQLIHAQWEKW